MRMLPGTVKNFELPSFDEKTGFVPRAQLTGDLAGYARTTEPQLALRVSPSTGANVIVRIPQGRRVLIVETDGQWKYHVPMSWTMRAATSPRSTATPPMRGMGVLLMRRLEG